MIVLQPDDLPKGSREEKHVLLTVQPRIPAATLRLVELPAGMVDDGTFAGSAAKEIKEELGQSCTYSVSSLSTLNGENGVNKTEAMGTDTDFYQASKSPNPSS